MAFGDFARNYLNPIYLAMRAGLLGGGATCLMITFASDAPVIGKAIAAFLGLSLFWIGVKPWGSGRGLSMNQLK